ncbi:DUF805 domain-containing protein [Burkholderia ubonensis]|uniref:DUF805 domain-containing protein n=1 Tax=Burkholderia ubonensis TaxID=101571 RepID=A0A107EKH1_9BURK|nr:DUF805 domain-containing protein [Burkholderia ubonensis]KVS40701.1 hypothetical protein WK37_22810 [Burkholderia ubonensis]KVS51317.1 hypothetical protein WK38_13755 [Burkholderia ubonensis]KVS76321.1 hypothetical protein WK42_19395 [Burkholderia ubonensis]KVS78559.1 hypothetical protein WK43_03635 [Burkholderia ubonensis]KVS82464.1 hypothetical protein WK44_26460 [Burkholderia ubonensis]
MSKNLRLGAGSYLLLMSLGVIAWSLLTGFACIGFAAKGKLGLAELNRIVSLLGTALGIAFYAASARRLRDLNFPGWSVKVLAFPLIGVIVLPVLCFLSGHRWDNQFGPAPAPSGFVKIAAALILFAIAVVTARWALGVYVQTRYLLAAAAGL